MGDIYSHIVHKTEDSQIRLTINEFRDIEYLHFRKYYLDFEGKWLPTKDGLSMPMSIDNIKQMFSALVEVLALAESKSILEENFKDELDNLYK